MVLAVMVVFLCFRVYQVLYPPPPPTGGRNFQPPRNELPADVETPGVPPRIPPNSAPENWANLWLRNPFIWVNPGTSRRINIDGASQVINLEVLNFQEVPDGSWKVQIQSARRGWYSEGDSFETYQLLSIDPDTECIEVFAEQVQRRVQICKE